MVAPFMVAHFTGPADVIMGAPSYVATQSSFVIKSG